MNVIGDEYHYILECPIFQENRNNYLNDFYVRNPNREKFILLFLNDNKQILSRLSKLCFEINKKFR